MSQAAIQQLFREKLEVYYAWYAKTGTFCLFVAESDKLQSCMTQLKGIFDSKIIQAKCLESPWYAFQDLCFGLSLATIGDC